MNAKSFDPGGAREDMSTDIYANHATTTSEKPRNKLLIDSGSTDHICNDRAQFMNYESVELDVSLGDDHIIEAVGRGTIKIPNGIGGTIPIQAYHVPRMGRNLISVIALAEQLKPANDIYTWENDKGEPLIKFAKQGNTMIIKDTPYLNSLSACQVNIDKECLQNRYLTSNYKLIEKAHKNKTILGLTESAKINKDNVNPCHPTVLEQRHRNISKTTKHLAKKPLEWTHIDICYPTKSYRGYNSVLLFTDEFSRRSQIVLLKNEANLHIHIRNYLEYWTLRFRDRDCIPLGIRCDNQFVTADMRKLCQDKHLDLVSTIPYCSWMNGVAERANQTFLRKLRTCLHIANVTQTNRWCLFARGVIYTHNRTPHSALAYKCPESIWTDKTIDNSHMRSIGCLVYGYIPKDKRKKLDRVRFAATLLGYKDTSTHAYVVLRHSDHKTVEIYDGKFNEKKFPGLQLNERSNAKTTSHGTGGAYYHIPTTSTQVNETVEDPNSGNDDQNDDQDVESENEIHDLDHSSQISEENSELEQSNNSNESINENMRLEEEENDSVTTENDITNSLPDNSQSTTSEIDSQSDDLNTNCDTSSPSPEDTLRVIKQTNDRALHLLPDRGGGISKFTQETMNLASKNPDTRVTRSQAQGEKGIQAHMSIVRDQLHSLNDPIAQDKVADLTTPEILKTTTIPKTFDEAYNGPDSEKWIPALIVEWNRIVKNKTFVYVKEPDKNIIKPIKTQWLFSVKYQGEDLPLRYKARLICKGYSQIKGENYDMTYAPVGRIESFRTLLAIAVQNKWKTKHLDVSTAFLYSDIDFKNILIDMPVGVAQLTGQDTTGLVCNLRKGLYGLKQSPKLWKDKLVKTLKSLNFKKSLRDRCLYSKNDGTEKQVIVIFWVDDILCTAPTEKLLLQLYNDLRKEYDVNDLGPPNYLLGMSIRHFPDGSMFLHQHKYLEKIVNHFIQDSQHGKATPLSPSTEIGEFAPGTKNVEENSGRNALLDNNTRYRSLIGSVLYAARLTRPDLTQAVNKLAQYSHMPRRHHWDAATHLIAYIKNTMDKGIIFRRNLDPKFNGVLAYSDANYQDKSDKKLKATTGNIVYLHGCPIAWSSKKQKISSSSTQEAELIALHETMKSTLWLKFMMDELLLIPKRPATIMEDNSAVISLLSDTSKSTGGIHYRTKLLKVENEKEDNNIRLEYVKSADQHADCFTKQISKEKFEKVLPHLRITECPSLDSHQSEEC